MSEKGKTNHLHTDATRISVLLDPTGFAAKQVWCVELESCKH